MGRMAALDAGYDIQARAASRSTASAARASPRSTSPRRRSCPAWKTGDRRRHRDDVATRPPPIRMARRPDGRRQPAPARQHPQSHQGVCADAIATLEGITRQAVDAARSASASSAPPGHRREATSRRASCRFTTRTAHWRWTTRNSRVRRRRSKASPALKPVFDGTWPMPVDDTGQDLRQPDPRKYPDIEASTTCTMPATRRAWSTARPPCCSPRRSYAKKHGLKPRARIVAMANIGDCPTLMLNAPVPAARKVLDQGRPEDRRHRPVRDQRGLRGRRREVHP